MSATWADLAEHWRGWKGELEWQDDSGTIAFVATHDGLGSVHFEVIIRRGADTRGLGRWDLRQEITLEAGKLDPIASAARSWLGISH